MTTSNWPADTLGELSTFCEVPFDEQDLSRFVEIALSDLARVFEARPELKELHMVTVLGEDAGEHYVNGSGFRCISIWTFFKHVHSVRRYHPLRHTRIDFGSDKFGH